MKGAHYRKYNDHSHNSGKYNKRSAIKLREKLKNEAKGEIRAFVDGNR